MKLNEILDIANQAYEQHTNGMLSLKDCYDFELEQVCKDNLGNTLALFIVLEIKDTYDENLDAGDQLAEASRVIQVAIAELDAIARALDEAARQHLSLEERVNLKLNKLEQALLNLRFPREPNS